MSDDNENTDTMQDETLPPKKRIFNDYVKYETSSKREKGDEDVDDYYYKLPITEYMKTRTPTINVGPDNEITDIKVLFTPNTGRVWDEYNLYSSFFTIPTDMFNIITIPKDTINILNKQALLELFTVIQEIENIEIDGYTYDDFCTPLFGNECSNISPFMYFDQNISNLESLPENDIIPYICNSSRTYIPFLYVFGNGSNITVENCLDPSYGIQSATGLSISMQITADTSMKNIYENWLKKAHDIASSYATQSLYYNVYHYSDYGLSTEVNRGVNMAIPMFIIDIVLVFCFLLFSLHEVHFTTTLLMASATLGCILSSLLLGLGLSLLLTIPWTSISIVIAFLALGLGADNSVLLGVLFLRTNKSWSLERRNSVAMSKSFVFILVTSLTTVLSFITGMNSSFDGIRFFCESSAIVMSTCFFTTFTCFDSFLVLIMRREIRLEQKDKQIKSSISSRHDASLYNNNNNNISDNNNNNNSNNNNNNISMIESNEEISTSVQRNSLSSLSSISPSSFLTPQSLTTISITPYSIYSNQTRKRSKPKDNSFLSQLFYWISPLYGSSLFCYCCYGVFIVLLSYSIYSCTKITQGIAPEDSVPYDSYTNLYFDIARDHFEETISNIKIVFYNTEFDKYKNRQLIIEIAEKSRSIPNILTTIDNPFIEYNNWCIYNNIDPKTQEGIKFLNSFIKFVKVNPRMMEKLSINLNTLDVNKLISAVVVTVPISQEIVNKLALGKDTMIEMRKLVDDSNNEYSSQLSLFSYTDLYHYFEMIGVTFNQTIINILTSAFAVLLVLLLFFSIIPALITMLCVLFADISILSWIPQMNLDLNAITSVILVMSVGIAVDFSAHITHSFTHQQGTGLERSKKTIQEMGRSLITSALTTFIGVFMLIFVPVPTNQMFFIMMSGVVLYGLLYGMILLPSLLSVINPGTEPKGKEIKQILDKDDEKQQIRNNEIKKDEELDSEGSS
ncbi:hypothetical protein WA158_006770 [Blastocystis sp. Blastoise]